MKRRRSDCQSLSVCVNNVIEWEAIFTAEKKKKLVLLQTPATQTYI